VPETNNGKKFDPEAHFNKALAKWQARHGKAEPAKLKRALLPLSKKKNQNIEDPQFSSGGKKIRKVQ